MATIIKRSSSLITKIEGTLDIPIAIFEEKMTLTEDLVAVPCQYFNGTELVDSRISISKDVVIFVGAQGPSTLPSEIITLIRGKDFDTIECEPEKIIVVPPDKETIIAFHNVVAKCRGLGLWNTEMQTLDKVAAFLNRCQQLS